jgi:predicted amidohydrolase YtcJ
MLVLHPRIYLAADGRTTDALLVRDGEVVAIGEQARREANEVEVVEPRGACVFPALADAHVHLWGLGLRAGTISLRGAESTEEVYRILRTEGLPASGRRSISSSLPAGKEWVLGNDWDQHTWSDADALDIDVLDEMFGDTPVILRRVDQHALWVNSAALKQADITEGWDPPGGHVGRRDDGRLSGLLVDDAMDPVLEAVGEPTVDEDREVFIESCEMLRSYGIASAHIAWMPLDRIQMLQELHETGELPIRVHTFLDAGDPGIEDVLERGPCGDRWLSIRGIKFFADGAMGSHGAHLLDGYPDGSSGLVLEDPEDLRRRSADYAARGYQVAVHAIGDAGARDVLDAFAAMDPADRAATRPRMEHAQMVTAEDCRRFGELGVVASIQPSHLRSDAAWVDEILSADQLERLFPWRRLADHAPILAAGSDYPIEDPNPWHGIATAVTRRDAKGRAFRAEQALTRQEILTAYTEGAAHAARWKGLGRLDPGYRADFAVLDRDPLTCAKDELWDVQVRSLWVDGEVGYDGED